VRVPDSPALSASQLATLAELGEERTANAGDVLSVAGEQPYAFITVLEVAILDARSSSWSVVAVSMHVPPLPRLSSWTPSPSA
jgi:hypothetical protein